MNGKDIELSRRRVLGGIATVGAASAAAGAGTFAYFSDTETSDSNSITAGTVDLGSPSNTGNSLTSTAAPGDDFTFEVEVTYEGSVDGVVLNLNAQVTEPGSEPGTEDNPSNTDLDAIQFAEAMELSTAEIEITDSSDGPTTFTDDLSTNDSFAESDPINNEFNIAAEDSDSGSEDTDFAEGSLDLEDVVKGINDSENSGSGTTNYATLDADDSVRVHLSGTINSSLGNIGQEDGVNLELAFNVQQSGDTLSAPDF